ncbi:MAG: InlB B-repeat-containing protein, partial [Bacilli bacterium]
TITFDKQSGSGGTSSTTATYNSAMPTITAPTRTGYIFEGYYSATNGGGTKYYNADGTSAKTCNLTSNTTLYAKWKANTYTITFDRNYLTSSIWTDTLTTSNWTSYNVGISKTTESLSTAMEGKLMKITINSVSGSGGPFFNSRLDLSIGSKYTEEFFIKASRNITLSNVGSEQGGAGNQINVTTNWQRFRHEFTAAGNTGQGYRAFIFYGPYSSNDVIYIHSLQVMKGTEGTTSITLQAGTTYGDSLPIPARTNYTFNGWFTSPSGGTEITSTSVVPASNTTLYAQYTYNGSTSSGGSSGGSTGGSTGGGGCTCSSKIDCASVANTTVSCVSGMCTYYRNGSNIGSMCY